jgi:hypothetical protein
MPGVRSPTRRRLRTIVITATDTFLDHYIVKLRKPAEVQLRASSEKEFDRRMAA